MDYNRIGQALRTAREQQGISLREAASRADISYSMIGMMEQGKAGDLKLGTLERVAAAVGAHVVVEVMTEGTMVTLPAGLETAGARLLQALPTAEPEDVELVLRWLERSSLHRHQKVAG